MIYLFCLINAIKLERYFYFNFYSLHSFIISHSYYRVIFTMLSMKYSIKNDQLQ